MQAALTRILSNPAHVLSTLNRNIFPASGMWLAAFALCAVNALWVLASPRLTIAPDFALSLFYCAVIAGTLALMKGPLKNRYGVVAERVLTTTSFGLFCFPVLDNLRVFNHLAMTIPWPLADQWLLAWDRNLGFDWQAYVTWALQLPTLLNMMEFAYSGMFLMVLLVSVAAMLTGRYRHAQEMSAIMMSTAIVCTLIAAMFPAEAAMATLADASIKSQLVQGAGDYHLQYLNALRSDAPHFLDTARLPGLSTFPSYHTAVGIVIVYASRWNRILLACGVTYTALMVSSTPIYGGHYFVDLLAGTVATCAVIYLWRKVAADRGLLP